MQHPSLGYSHSLLVQVYRCTLLYMLFCSSLAFSLNEAADPLPSWNNRTAKQKILNFICAVTQADSPHFVPIKDRIAVFDQDGTLWVEQPLYVEVLFAIDYAKTHSADEEWTRQQPFKPIFNGDLEAARNLSLKSVKELIVKTHTGMSIDEFHESVKQWLNHTLHPRFKKKYTELVYQPMLEVMDLFKKNQFEVYIVSGSGQEFTRAYSEYVYDLPPSKIIGSAFSTKYENIDGQPHLIKEPKLILLDDKKGKPEGINLIIGKKPIVAFGNSTGDREMLEWTQSHPGKTLQMLVHHDDSVREYAYGPHSKIGKFSDELMEEAEKRGWGIISMKDDWAAIFSFQQDPVSTPLRCYAQ